MAHAVPLQRGGRGASGAALTALVVAAHVWLSSALQLGVRAPGFNAHIPPPPSTLSTSGALAASCGLRPVLTACDSACGAHARTASRRRRRSRHGSVQWRRVERSVKRCARVWGRTAVGAACCALGVRSLPGRLPAPDLTGCTAAAMLAEAALCPLELRHSGALQNVRAACRYSRSRICRSRPRLPCTRARDTDGGHRLPNDEDWPTADPYLPSNPPGQARRLLRVEVFTSAVLMLASPSRSIR